MTDSDNGTDLLRQKAESGDIASQFLLGKAYDQGEGIEQNFEKAAEWYLKAAKQGNVDAQFNLAVSYENGQGVKRNLDTAVSWYLKAAEQGDADAQFNLGELYAEGREMDPDLAEATKWYRKAAEQGDTEAQERVQKLIGLSRSHDSKKPFIPEDYKDILWPKNKKRKGYRVAFYITLPIALFFLVTRGYSFPTITALIIVFFLKYKSENA